MNPSLAANSFVTGLSLMASLIVAIGAQNTFVLRQGLRREHVLAVVLACTLVDAVLMALGVSGLAASLGDSPRALNALGLLGAAVLAVYGALALRRALAHEVLQAHTEGQAVPRARVLAQVLSLSLLNPHVYLDTVVLVGSVGARQPAGMQGVFLLGACMASGIWFTSLGFGARLLRPLFARPLAWRVLDLLVTAMMWTLAYSLLMQSML